MAYKDKQKEWARQYRSTPENKEKARQSSKKWYAIPENKEKERQRQSTLEYKNKKKQYQSTLEYKEKQKQYRNTSEQKEKKKQYDAIPEHREKNRQSHKQRYATDIEYKEYRKKYDKQKRDTPEYRDKHKQYNKQYQVTPEYRVKRNQHHKQQYQTDLMFRLNNNISSAIRNSLNTNKLSKNGRHWEDLVGYTLEDLKTHLEKQFESWMNWNNFGKSTILNTNWSTDHIVPLSAFNFTSTDDEEFKLAWGLDNLQPLDTYINLYVKRDRLDYYIEFPIQK